MSELIIYGTMLSRAARIIWMAEELGIDYSLESVDVHKGEQREGGYDALNPNAKVPTIKDGDFILWESLAINLYLAKKHGGPLAPKTAEDEAHAVQWSMWALTEAEDNAVILIQKALSIVDHSEEKVSGAHEALKKPLAVVEKVLSGQDYLLGSEFTVADLNVACVLGTLPRSNVDISGYPKTEAWLKSCVERPASQRMGKMRAAAMKH
ncbi:MAG: glutathione S-transferase family protein [Rhodospirillaceae bacterium]|jgi:glutathione S-transferase|nr:glutathione S-transferase family protein [Rhodospirillaceae bacterium]MBT3884064.1 glutathione S-transferase family protein [Rhodospirillaceae bacterium]MBT4118302.1 glutathione S-transferase family protein [Rhodospirillaceae bacterium]MBT4674582.1 glutathione S-transferase family protein [Rhodospirillaceae bacterium]MBT4720849.1 glutathione S-transferase family protein [Rhodospirillaceae bacterium]